jgi:hypothetical protein
MGMFFLNKLLQVKSGAKRDTCESREAITCAAYQTMQHMQLYDIILEELRYDLK